MHVYQSPSERKADAQAALRSVQRRFHLAEHLEDVGHLDRGDADACIGHYHHDFVVLLLDAQRDTAHRRRVLCGVDEEVGEDLRESRQVALDVQ